MKCANFISVKLVFYVKEFEDMREEGKSKAVSVQAWTGPEDSRRLSLPHLKQSTHEGGKVGSLTHRPPLTPLPRQEIFLIRISVRS